MGEDTELNCGSDELDIPQGCFLAASNNSKIKAPTLRKTHYLI